MPSRMLFRLSAFFGLCLLAACGGSSSPNVPAGNAVGGSSSNNAPAADFLSQEYTLAAGDRVIITVFGQENLSGERDVSGSGTVSIPLIGDIPALGLSTGELEDRIEERFTSEQILVSPQVGVDVLNYRPFFILGEVNQPGQYEYQSGLTIIGAIARAGGFTYRANEEVFLLQRGGSNAPEMAVKGAVSILPGDVIEVEERWF